MVSAHPPAEGASSAPVPLHSPHRELSHLSLYRRQRRGRGGGGAARPSQGKMAAQPGSAASRRLPPAGQHVPPARPAPSRLRAAAGRDERGATAGRGELNGTEPC